MGVFLVVIPYFFDGQKWVGCPAFRLNTEKGTEPEHMAHCALKWAAWFWEGLELAMKESQIRPEAKIPPRQRVMPGCLAPLHACALHVFFIAGLSPPVDIMAPW